MFKLTEEVIKEIEEKVNKNLIDVNACWIIINIEICQKYRIDIVENGNGEII